MLRVAQGVSQVGLHMTVAFGLMYAVTGSVTVGGVAAVIEPICNVLLLPLHDRVWLKLRQRASRLPLRWRVSYSDRSRLGTSATSASMAKMATAA